MTNVPSVPKQLQCNVQTLKLASTSLDVELLRQAAKKIGIKTRKVVDAYQMELRRLGAISIFD